MKTQEINWVGKEKVGKEKGKINKQKKEWTMIEMNKWIKGKRKKVENKKDEQIQSIKEEEEKGEEMQAMK